MFILLRLLSGTIALFNDFYIRDSREIGLKL